MTIAFHPLPTRVVRGLQSGGPDAHDAPAERRVSDGAGVPCRHCLKPVKKGDAYLVVAHRPFSALQPYAECGPIFLHADPCEAEAPGATLPAILASETYIVRGYGPDERIVYGTGGVVPRNDIPDRAASLLQRTDIAFVDVRSAANNCYQCRIRRA